MAIIHSYSTGGADGPEPEKISEKRGTLAIMTSKEQMMLIIEESEQTLSVTKQHGWLTPECHTI